MRTFLVSLASLALIAVLGGAIVIYLGLFNVAATDHHAAPVYWLMEQARVRSIKVRAAGITPPAGLDDPRNVVIGTEHFAAHCAVCHGAPGVPKGDIAMGLYPAPPNLAESATRYDSSELFWIVKNGIKMTGMPAWSDHGDDELWAVVVFIKKLPSMSEQDYAKLVVESMVSGGHHHHGGDQQAEPPAKQ